MGVVRLLPDVISMAVAVLASFRADISWHLAWVQPGLQWVLGLPVLGQVILALQLARVLLHQLQDRLVLALVLWRQELFAHGYELVAQLELGIVLAGTLDADGADVLALVADADDERILFLVRFAWRLVGLAQAQD